MEFCDSYIYYAIIFFISYLPYNGGMEKTKLAKKILSIKNILHFVFLALSAESNDQDTLWHAMEKSVSPWVLPPSSV